MEKLIFHGSLTRAYEKGSASLNIIFDFLALLITFIFLIAPFNSLKEASITSFIQACSLLMISSSLALSALLILFTHICFYGFVLLVIKGLSESLI